LRRLRKCRTAKDILAELGRNVNRNAFQSAPTRLYLLPEKLFYRTYFVYALLWCPKRPI
jgi:hypothetical protein